MRDNLWDDPRVIKIVDMTDSSEATVIGSLYWLWSTADQHTEDGFMPSLTLRSIDRKTGVNGFAAAMCSIGWLEEKSDGVLIVDFDKHNGTSAKKRCQTAKRVAKHEAANGKKPKNHENSADHTEEANATLTHDVGITNADSVSSALAREREEKNNTDTSVADELLSSDKPTTVVDEPAGNAKPDDGDHPPVFPAKQQRGNSFPPCPIEKIIELYLEELPELPGVRVIVDARKRAIKKRWEWVLSSTKPDGSRRAENTQQAVEWFRDFFELARENDFLMGRTPKAIGHTGWKCDIDFLMSDKGLTRVLEKTEVAA